MKIRITAARSPIRPREVRLRRRGRSVGTRMGGEPIGERSAGRVAPTKRPRLPDGPKSPRRNEQAPAPSVGRRVQLPGRERLAPGNGSGQAVVVTVGAGNALVVDHPGPARSAAGSGQDAARERGDDMVAGDLLDALRLPLAVGRTDLLRDGAGIVA